MVKKHWRLEKYYNYFIDIYNKHCLLYKIGNIIIKPKEIIRIMMDRGYLNWLNDKMYLKIKYRNIFNEKLNLNNPNSFDQKLQWLKLFDRNPKYTMMVDKYTVRDYIKKQLGEEYLIPILGVYDKFDEINFKDLPEKFVIKCNHNSGGIIICSDKSKFLIDYSRKKINKYLKENYYYRNREWPYKNVIPKIIIEEYMSDSNDRLIDYKFYCFDGKCDYVLVCCERETGTPKFYYLDKKWNLKNNMTRDGMSNSTSFNIPKPNNLSKMFAIAKKLSVGFPFLRVDLYNIEGKIYFSEFTFYPNAGFDTKRTVEAKKYLNSKLNINKFEKR